MNKKKCILMATILMCFFSCIHETKSDLTFQKKATDSLCKLEKPCIDKKEIILYCQDAIEYSVVASLCKLKKVCIDKKEIITYYQDTIEYSDEENRITFEKDTIIYKLNAKRREISLINGKPLKKYKVENSQFNTDSMDLVLDLDELNICYLKKKPNIIIIETTPMNWVGRMTRFSFYQIINKKENTVAEFIKEDD